MRSADAPRLSGLAPPPASSDTGRGWATVRGYNLFTFSRVQELPEVVADTGAYMRVLGQPPQRSTATSPPQA